MLFLKTIQLLLGNAFIFNLQIMAGLLAFFLLLKFAVKLRSVVLYYMAVLLQTIGFIAFVASFFLSKESTTQNIFLGEAYEDKVSTFISLSYLAVTFFFLVKLMVSFRKLYNNNQPKVIVSAYLETFVQNVIDAYLPHKTVIVKWVDSTINILTYGFIKPVIVLPVASINHLTEDELKAIILHEIAHIKYAHFFINIWVEVVRAVLWFNPFNYLLYKEINFYREASADAFVLQQTANHFSYANGLYKLALQTLQPKCLVALPAVGTKNELLKRIQFFTQQKPSFIFSAKHFIISFIVVACLVGISKISVTQQKQSASISTKIILEQKKAHLNTSLKPITQIQPAASKNITKAKVLPKQFRRENEQNLYLEQSKKNYTEGLKYLSELAIENPTIQNIINDNPTIIPVALKQKDIKESVRRFIIPATENKGAILVKITVKEQPNNKPKVIIELEEQPLIQAS